MGPSLRGLAHFVTVALPKYPKRALKLGDGTSLTGVACGSAGLKARAELPRCGAASTV